MSSGLFYDQKKGKTLLALSNGQIVYRGYKPDTSQDLMRTMLVIRNRKTGKVRLVQAERWQVAPVLDKPVLDNVKGNEDDKIARLNKQFGSKKVKRRTEQYEKLKINVDTVKEQLEQTVSSKNLLSVKLIYEKIRSTLLFEYKLMLALIVADVEIDRLDLSTQLPENEYITNTSLPECNRDATNVSDVYNIFDIIPENKLQALYDTATEVLNDDKDIFGGYVCPSKLYPLKHCY